ncbi:hypothetical protein ACQ4PT_068201 [Festuca glaucescens]
MEDSGARVAAVQQLMAAKSKSGKSFSDIGAETGLTNVLNEAIMHFGESIKDIINEDFGDGIMSAIDFYCTVDKVKGVDGKDRAVITFDGKYLPHTEQKSANMMSKLARNAP